MSIDNIKSLMEAYSEVYAPQEVDEATAMAKRGYDETKLRKRAGGGEAADRASALENKPTYGDKNKQAQRSRYARAQRGDFRKTASSNPGLHGYAHKSDDPKVKAKQAARGAQRGALTPKERTQLNMGDETFDIFDVVLEFLYVEGYAETLEEAEWMMANELTDEDIDEIIEAYKEPNLAKMRKQEDRHRTAAVKQKGGSRGSSKNRAMKMGSIRGALERGEDPRADGYGGKRAERGNPPEDHRAAFSKNPLNNPPRRVKKPGV
jgi:hypothetical protein